MTATRDEGPALEAVAVGKWYDSAPALVDVSLALRVGECVALVGESGAGKSTLLRCFNRLVDPDRGTVCVHGADVAASDAVALRRQIGYVQQEGGLLPHWSALRNASLVPTLIGMRDAPALAAGALDRVGLPASEYGGRRPGSLSGGQRQRVALARAIAAAPRVLLLDEPFGALDALTRRDAQDLLVQLRRELPLTVLLVTHDLWEAARLADRIAVLRTGRVEQVGPPAMLLAAPATPYVRALVARAGLAGGSEGQRPVAEPGGGP